MKYWYFVPQDGEFEQAEEKTKLPPNQPLMPAIFIDGSDNNKFVGTTIFGECRQAKLIQLDIDPDELVIAAQECYPGIPESLIKANVTDMIFAATELPKNLAYRVMVEEDRAALYGVSDDNVTRVLWDNRSIELFM